MYSKLFLILFIIGMQLTASAQKSVLSTLGLGFVNGSCNDLYMTSTIGQVLSGTVSCDPYSVLIGFQQPSDIITTPTYDLVFSDLKLYPNPAIDKLVLSGTLTRRGNPIHLKLIDMLGRLHQQYTMKEHTENFSIDIHSLVPGMYSLVITRSSHETQSILFIKQ
ncbi:MAG: T9SS type A sorting domain-containing protein [Saprospiraceae bacterium]|nr:T9SS type A sorting domain-containing protein [Saprospiraceae bacterium]